MPFYTIAGIGPANPLENHDSMKLVPMLDLLRPALAGGYAVPAFCAWNAEMIATILSVAADMRAPVILMHGPAEFALLSPADMGAVARAVASRFATPAALHLDHGTSFEHVDHCLDAGFTSVMLDYSSRPYAENMAALRQVAAASRSRGVTVEGEIGHVGKVDTVTTEGGGISTLTEVSEAVSYAAETGVDALAISIGNAHGSYTRLPKLDFQRLAEIHAAVEIPLVLHGGSGTPEEDLQRAISLGVAKINVATELVNTVRESLMSQWQNGQNRWTPTALATATQAAAPVVEKWIRSTGAAGRA
jgi:ketose-bisphosphate aldolase